MKIELPEDLESILRQTPALARAYLVGGCVRDALLGRKNKDLDIEVFGVTLDELARALQPWGKVDLVGRSFGVIKLNTGSGHSYDFSIPRRDSKVAAGHKGFEVAFDLSITPREAAARRDYTINAFMYDPRNHELLDFFDGKADLQAGILRHTSPAFPEDPLRVLRGMQFAGRFQLRAAPETIALARQIKSSHSELARERVREEWFKWAEKSAAPSLGLRFLAETEWIEHYPELNALRDVPQEQEWHPEGDVFTHTCHCMDALVQLEEWKQAAPEARITLALAVLTHDFGKPVTTRREMKRGRSRIVSPGHEDAGAALAEKFLERIDAPLRVRERVRPLVANHMAHFDEVTDRAVRRLSKRLEPSNIEALLVLMKADSFGRPPLPRVVPSGVQALASRAGELAVTVAAPKPLVLGRHLVAAGIPAGPEMGIILKEVYEAQLSGKFHTTAAGLEWVAEREEFALSSGQKSRLVQLAREGISG